MELMNICPVCGYDQLVEPPYDKMNYPSYEICPCCGFEYGFDDTSNGLTFDQYRSNWLEKGFPYFNEEARPENWNESAMSEQLRNIKKVNYTPRI